MTDNRTPAQMLSDLMRSNIELALDALKLGERQRAIEYTEAALRYAEEVERLSKSEGDDDAQRA